MPYLREEDCNAKKTERGGASLGSRRTSTDDKAKPFSALHTLFLLFFPFFPNSAHECAEILSLKMSTNAVNVAFFLLALALGLAMAQLPVSCFLIADEGVVSRRLARGERRRVCLLFFGMRRLSSTSF